MYRNEYEFVRRQKGKLLLIVIFLALADALAHWVNGTPW